MPGQVEAFIARVGPKVALGGRLIRFVIAEACEPLFVERMGALDLLQPSIQRQLTTLTQLGVAVRDLGGFNGTGGFRW